MGNQSSSENNLISSLKERLIYSLSSNKNEYIANMKTEEIKKKLGDKFNVSNDLNQSARFIPYWEILVYSGSGTTLYDYVSSNNSVQTIDGTELKIDPKYKYLLNDKRFYIFDRSILLKEEFEENEEFPNTMSIPFKNPSYDSTKEGSSETLNVYLKLNKVTTTSPNFKESGEYKETQVDRTSIFTYYPKKTMYLLINSIDKKIYAMQTFTNQVSSFFQGDLPYLRNQLMLPEGWIFTLCDLDSDTYVNLISSKDHRAKVIQDNLGNSYQYVREEEAPFLYECFNK